MLELRTLGTIDLRGEDGRRIDSVVHHAKRASLLAHLCASHPPRLHRRATLLSLLWPELDEAHARGALRHELYELRRALGPGVVLGDGADSVGVDAHRIWCDAQAFESALHAGHPAEALGFYQGEFLPGLHIDGGDSNHSLDETRDRFRRRAIDAARALASAAEEGGDVAEAIRWSRRETELAPYDESGWQRLIVLLDRAGDRGGALRAYDALAALLRNELEVEPSPETHALVERIRQRSEAFDAPGGNGHSATTRERPGTTVVRRGDGDGRGGDDTVQRVVATAARTTQPAASFHTVIRLLPVDNQTGDAAFDAVCRRVGERLAQALVEPPFIKLVAAENGDGVKASVSTVVFRRGDRIEVRTSLAEAGAGGRILAFSPAVPITREASDDSLDTIAAHTLAAVCSHYDPRALGPGEPEIPFRMRSWDAYLEYLQGSELFGQRQFQEAARRLLTAHEMDRSFVKAALFGGIALQTAGQPEQAESVIIGATAGRALTEYERHFAAYILADIRGRRPEAYRAAMELIRITHHPVFMGIAARESIRMGRPREAMQTAAASGHLGHGWWRNWTEIPESFGGALHVLGEHRSELSFLHDTRARLPEALDLIRAEARARAALGESEQALDLVRAALIIPPTQAITFPFGQITPADVAWTAAQELDAHGQPEAATEVRALAIQWSIERSESTTADRLLEARLVLETGEAERASQIVRALPSSDDPEFLGVAGLVSAGAGDEAGARAALSRLEGLDGRYLCGRHLLHAAGIRAALGDCAGAVLTLRRAFAAGLPFGVELHALPMLRPLADRRELQTLLRPRE